MYDMGSMKTVKTSTRTISPRQAARALGASESSLKRWCDSGLIATTRTAGGHRRLSVDAIAEFSRQAARPPVRPELLGLPASSTPGQRSLSVAADDLLAGLVSGDEERCRRVIFDLHLAGHSVARIGDVVVAEVLHRMGDLWEHRELQVYEERRACELCLRVLGELRSVVPGAVGGRAPLACGGTPECDPYGLPTALVELTLRQHGWRASSLGARLPWATLQAAAERLRPRLFWLSVSHLDDEDQFLVGYAEFQANLPGGTSLVVGGRALTESLRRQMNYTAHCDNLQHLESLIKALMRSGPPRRRQKDRQASRGRLI